MSRNAAGPRGRAPLGLIALAVLALAALLRPAPALAFECTAVPPCPSDDPGCPAAGMPSLSQAWNQRCVPIWLGRGDDLFAGPSLEGLVLAAFARWSDELACTDFEVVFMGYTDDGPGFDVNRPDDQKNVVLSVSDPAAAQAIFDEPNLLALTLTTFSTETGEILDADIVFNTLSTDFRIVESAVACRREGGFFDIENTLVHEVGHFFGFDHVDIQDATMFARAEACETKKRDLDPDDALAMCTVYATGAPTRTCLPPASYARGNVDDFRDQCERAMSDGCSCRTHRAQAPGSWLAALTLLALLGRTRRRPSSARPR